MIPIFDLEGKKVGQTKLPSQFNEPVRPDLIRRAVLALQSHRLQPYGKDPLAGKRQGKATPKRRRKFGTTYGYGISRIARKRLWRRGGRFGWVGAFVASAVKGIKAFAPTPEKKLEEKINKKERRKAIRSALAASADSKLVKKRHKFDGPVPLIVTDEIESITKAKDLANVLNKLNLEKELERAKQKKIRAGKGKMRGRKYRKKKGPLLIVSEDVPVLKAARSLNIDATAVKNLNVSLLAPGAQPGRLTIWSKAALEKLEKEKLFS